MGISCTFFRVEYLQTLFGIFLLRFISTLLTYLSNHLHQCELTDTYFMLWVRIQCNVVFFFSEIISRFVIRNSFSWLPYALTLPHPSSVQGFVLFCVLSDTTSCSRLIFRILCGSPKIIYFCKEFSFLFLENGVRNQDLGTRSAHCCWNVIASKSSQMTKQGDRCMYSYQYLYTYL